MNFIKTVKIKTTTQTLKLTKSAIRRSKGSDKPSEVASCSRVPGRGSHFMFLYVIE